MLSEMKVDKANASGLRRQGPAGARSEVLVDAPPSCKAFHASCTLCAGTRRTPPQKNSWFESIQAPRTLASAPMYSKVWLQFHSAPQRLPGCQELPMDLLTTTVGACKKTSREILQCGTMESSDHGDTWGEAVGTGKCNAQQLRLRALALGIRQAARRWNEVCLQDSPDGQLGTRHEQSLTRMRLRGPCAGSRQFCGKCDNVVIIKCEPNRRGCCCVQQLRKLE